MTTRVSPRLSEKSAGRPVPNALPSPPSCPTKGSTIPAGARLPRPPPDESPRLLPLQIPAAVEVHRECLAGHVARDAHAERHRVELGLGLLRLPEQLLGIAAVLRGEPRAAGDED